MSEPTRSVKGPGDYRVYVGIDPYGHAPAAFGQGYPSTVIWSDPVLDVQTRGKDATGKPIDEWTRLSVTVRRAQADNVTVYTRGQPEYRTKHNDSYWDEACIQVLSAPTAAPSSTPVPQPSATLRPTSTPPPVVTATSLPTLRPTWTMLPPVTPLPTWTPWPTATEAAVVPVAQPSLEAPHIPTLRTATVTLVPSGTVTARPVEPAGRSRAGLALGYVVVLGLTGAVIWWIREDQRSR